MPDLVIKPTAGAGNKLILQDQGGGALVTSDDSGAIIASGVTVPAAGVTGVLPVGVTGGSGLDAISAAGVTGVLPVGVTGGSGLNAVPATTGSIIQTVSEVYNGGNSDTTTSATQSICEASSVYHWKCTINNVLADSKVLISANFTFELAHLGIDPNCGFSFWRGTSTKIFPTDQEGQATFYYCPRTTGTQTQFYCAQTNLEWLDTTPDTGSTTYYLGYATGHTTVKIGSSTGSSTAHDFSMMLQEIAG